LSIQTIQTKPIRTDLWTNRWEPSKTESLKRTDSNEQFHHESDVVFIIQFASREREREERTTTMMMMSGAYLQAQSSPHHWLTRYRKTRMCNRRVVPLSHHSYVAMNVFWDAVSPQQGQRDTAEASASGINVSYWRSVSLSFPFWLIATDKWWFALDQWSSVHMEGGFVITV